MRRLRNAVRRIFRMPHHITVKCYICNIDIEAHPDALHEAVARHLGSFGHEMSRSMRATTED